MTSDVMTSSSARFEVDVGARPVTGPMGSTSNAGVRCRRGGAGAGRAEPGPHLRTGVAGETADQAVPVRRCRSGVVQEAALAGAAV
ncbi:hypothetical protein, partial [Geodermatophilus sp. CPCC 205506]|uniref:hypothetical protein n=1 Tax=Geodermatophilus sp. CPCC 205506 TaxID=2936596 RepID=UPI003EECBB3F